MLTERVPNIGKEEVDINNVTLGNISSFSNLEKNASNDNLEVPDYKGDVKNLVSKIDDVNTLVRKGLMKTEVANKEVAELESQIHFLESSRQNGENNKKIDELRSELENINRGVQANDRNFKDSDKRVEKIESEIRNLEGGKKFSKNGETTELISESEKSSEVNSERVEYLRLKQKFKQAERAYYDAISEDYTTRDHVSKLFGAGRMNMSSSVQEAYDKFMEANKAYYKFSQSSGTYQKITERLNRNRSEEVEKISATPLIAGRHILNPAEKRLELQTVKLPEGLQKLKDGLVDKIKSHPKTALTLAGLVVLTNPARLVGFGTGLATMYFGDRFYVKPKEERQNNLKNEASALVADFDELDLEALEQEYFEAANLAHNAKRHTRMAAVAAGATVGAAAISADAAVEETLIKNTVPDNLPVGDIKVVSENIVPFRPNGDLMNYEDVIIDSEESPLSEVVDNLSDTEREILPASESSVETGFIHEVKPGENLSTILLDSIKEKIATGEISLPPSVNQDQLSHYMYQSFPEMTNASDISPRLSPEEWIKLGVESGNPQDIKPGETIDIQTLLEKMWGSSLETNNVESVSADVSADSIPVSDGANADATTEPATVSEDVSDKSQPVNADSIFAPKSLSVEDLQVAEVAMGNSEPSFSAEPTPAPEGTSESIPQVESDEEILVEDFYKVSPDYEEITHQFAWRESMHEYLASVIQVGVDKGEIALPLKVAFGENDFSDNIMGLVEERLPEVSRSLGNWDPDALTPEQWKQFGISSGDPKDISSDDVFKPGKLFEYIVSGEKDVLLNKSE